MNKENAHIPVIVGCYSPFRLILRDHDSWSPTLDQLNGRDYDYVKLHRVSTYVDAGSSWSMGIGFDGVLVLPATPEYRDDPQQCLSIFNRVLAEVLVGGLYCEAMAPNDLCLGEMTVDSYCKIRGPTRGARSSFHRAIRSKHAGALDIIDLLHPETASVADFETAIRSGRAILEGIGANITETLIHGTTFFARNQWTEALIHLWTTIEQLIGVLWRDEMVNQSSVEGILANRRKAFLQDHRTWTASTITEVLFQKGLISEPNVARIDRVRSARNQFVHETKMPNPEVVDDALGVAFDLAESHVAEKPNPVADVPDMIRNRSKLFREWSDSETARIEPTAWLSMPPLPGDLGWDAEEEYEVIDELILKPLIDGKFN